MPNAIKVTQRLMPKIYKLGDGTGIQPIIDRTPIKIPDNINKKKVPSDWPWYNPFGIPTSQA